MDLFRGSGIDPMPVPGVASWKTAEQGRDKALHHHQHPEEGVFLLDQPLEMLFLTKKTSLC